MNVTRGEMNNGYWHAEPGAAGGAGDAGGAGGGDAGAGGAGDGGTGDKSGDGGAGAGGAGGEGGTGEGGKGGETVGFYDALGKSENWRKDIAGDNEGWSKRLERYNDPKAFIESAFQAHDKLRAGEVSTGLPENPTEEQLKEYREANGIPVDGAYQLDVGRDLAEVDNDMLKGVLEASLAGNVPTEVLNAQLKAYYDARDALLEDMATQDNLDKAKFTEIAKENWGGDYQANMNRITNRMNMLPEEVRESVMNARMGNGTALFNSPEFMNFLVAMDREINPMDPLPGGDEASLKDIHGIIEKAEKRMAEDRDGWYKDKAAQKEYMQALDARARFEGSQ